MAESSKASRTNAASWLIGPIFFVSGIPALLYQIVWQRSLFAIYGIDSSSVTAVVAAFMLGLGLGSLMGGRISAMPRAPLLLLFGGTEAVIGIFGFFSLSIFDAVGDATLGASALGTGALAFALVVLPTLLMGATLPMLTTYLVRGSGSVGSSLGILYFVNTLGAALACFLAATVLMHMLGMQGTVNLAVALNLAIGLVAIAAHAALRRADAPRERPSEAAPIRRIHEPPLPLSVGVVLSGCAGFISLSYEILWIRAYSYASAGYATNFPLVLGSFLTGIALGSLWGRRIAARLVPGQKGAALSAIGRVVLIVNLLAFGMVPLAAVTVVYIKLGIMLLYTVIASVGFGVLFPLIAHATVPPDARVGQGISYLYVANIVGSTLGSLTTGFVLMDLFGFAEIATGLATLGALLAAWLLVTGAPTVRTWRGRALALAALVVALASTGTAVHADMYGRLLFREKYPDSSPVVSVVETKSGICTVTANGKLYGGGVYDGEFHVDLKNDTNMLIRPAAIGAFRRAPKRVLIIGLGTGSWARIVEAHPAVESTTIVEMNTGQIQVLRDHPEAGALLDDPKTTVILDDARRWLKHHPDEKFDVVVMNTTYHWRAHATNLLSREFLELVRAHMTPRGVALYNATGSPESYKTGAEVFPHAVRILNSMLVSDAPLVPDKALWRETLLATRVDGKPLFDANVAGDLAHLEHTLGLLDTLDDPPDDEPEDTWGLEDRASLLSRLGDARVITDDNMASEWQHIK